MEILLSTIFILGYVIITLEHSVKINKSAIALLTGVLLWSVYILSGHSEPAHVNSELLEHLGDISGILFFLMAAMTIVELIDAHDGFEIITSAISTRNKVKLIWLIGVLSFFLSAVLDNLTTTIVMISLARKLIDDKEDRLLFAGIIVISANAGGAWSPIGDVTTTMLWIGGQITAGNIMMELFIPSLVCMIIPLFFFSLRLKGEFKPIQTDAHAKAVKTSRKEQTLVLYSGLLALIFVPIFKTYTHLPPFMGILFGLSILWVIVELLA